jgi:tetratricopeptide (TPR) repeat protein
MRALSLLAGAILLMTPAALAADAPDRLGLGFICSAEQDAPPAGSVRQLVMVKGVGTGGFPVATGKPEAQAWFDYGMKLAHAFYHADAARAFQKAQAIDPDCAMCVWGEAWATGPTINFGIDDSAHKAAKALADKAAALGGQESPKNRALIAALQLRYASHDAASDFAFAKAMDALSRAHPDDDEIAILTSDAWLILWALHEDEQGVPRAVEVLQPVLKRHPDNTGAIHFYIHATEEAGEPALALPYAERLAALAPEASHLVHMASHTYFRVGRYEDAALANAQAIGADGEYLRAAHDATPQGKVPYHGHDLHFGLASALAAGDTPLALRLADHTWFAFPASARDNANAEVNFGVSYIVYGRFAPTKALGLPEPGKTAPLAAALRHYGRGEAYAALGDAAAVRAEAAQTTVSKDGLAAEPAGSRDLIEAMARIARLTLEGRAAMMAGDSRSAIGDYEAAAKIQDDKLAGRSHQDPPPWWYPERRSLAAAFLAAGQPARAAEEAHKALRAWPNEPLTLQVLSEAETQQRQAEAAGRHMAAAKRGWHGGPVPLARI